MKERPEPGDSSVNRLESAPGRGIWWLIGFAVWLERRPDLSAEPGRMMSRVGRVLPSLARLPASCAPSVSGSLAPRVSSVWLGSWDESAAEDGKTDGLAAILSGWNASFSRGLATDALTTDTGGWPSTVAAMKNPSHKMVYDDQVHQRFPPGDPSKKAFTYFVLTGGRFAYASALRLLVLKLVLSMSASKDVLAMASLEVDLSSIEPGATVTVKWRGKPVFIRRRTEEDIKAAASVNLSELRDPQPDEVRVQKPEWLVVIGVCTHLGCVPLPNAGDYHGWFCPCHGSHYDTSGRVRKGPAPYNLEVPTYSFLEENKILVG